MRDNKGRWQKGAPSPNPGGRPALLTELRSLAQEHTLDAINTLTHVCNDISAPASARVTAACAILDRGYGRPLQSVENKIEIQNLATTAAQVLMGLTENARQEKEREKTAIIDLIISS